MSVLHALLGPAPEPLAHNPHIGELRHLLLDDDVLVHLHDVHRDEQIALYSVPGLVPDAPWLARHTQTWSHAVPLPDDERALAVLQVEPATRELFLAEVWPRAVLDATTLGQRLDKHLVRHREWREALNHVNNGGSPACTG